MHLSQGIILAIAFTALSAPSFAGTPEGANHGPDMDDLRTYLLCEELSQSQVLMSYVSADCVAARQKVKLAFVPNIDSTRFQGLDPDIQKEIDGCGRDHFQEWSARNADFLATLKAQVLANHFTADPTQSQLKGSAAVAN